LPTQTYQIIISFSTYISEILPSFFDEFKSLGINSSLCLSTPYLRKFHRTKPPSISYWPPVLSFYLFVLSKLFLALKKVMRLGLSNNETCVTFYQR
jgi:predicted transcriptional regulator